MTDRDNATALMMLVGAGVLSMRDAAFVTEPTRPEWRAVAHPEVPSGE